MLAHLGQNIDYRGLVFHLQTEHSRGRDAAHQITSSLFFGGSVVSSRKACYQLDDDPQQLRGKIGKLLRRQHANVLHDLREGRLDAKIASTPGTGEFRPIPAAQPAVSPDLPQLKPTRLRRPSWPLDGAAPRRRRSTALHSPDGMGPPVYSAQHHFAAGILALRRCNYDQAVREWASAAALEPENTSYQKNLELARTLMRFFLAGKAQLTTAAARNQRSRRMRITSATPVRAP